MFSLDRWQEIYETMRRNKLRTFLTSLSVAWGIFMLVLLLGAGTGLQNGVEYRLRDDAVNSIWLRRGKTSTAYKGQQPGRRIQFHNEDFDAIGRSVDGVEHMTARYYLWGEGLTTYKDKASAFEIRACHPAHKYLEKTIISKGRFLNQLDLDERRKVAVIGSAVNDFLFEGKTEAIGKYIAIRGIRYLVVGVFEDVGGEGELRKIYIPITTAQMAYGGANRVHQIMFTIGDASADDSRRIADDAHQLLASRLRFDPTDPRAIRVRNNVEQYEKVTQIFKWIRLFMWIVGAGTIVAGIVGVSNIMLISVKERTKEFGVRKALGATPGSIVGMVLQEAVLLTATAGYCGMVVGVALLEIVASLISRAAGENEIFMNPSVDLSVIVTATALLVVCGGLAGFFPAWRAAHVNPVVALRDE
jgi:putative ABC transport system permease protein